MNELIDKLSNDLKQQRPMRHPAVRLLPWIALVFAYVAGFIFLSGVRADLDERMDDPIFIYEVTSVIVIAVTAAMAALWLCVPDMAGKNWVIAVPIVLSLNFLHWMCCKAYGHGLHLPPFNVDHCMYEGVELFFVPALALTIITNRGATTHPYMLWLMNVIAACSVSYIGLRFTCMADSVGHSFVYHILPLVLLGTLLGVLARRIFKW